MFLRAEIGLREGYDYVGQRSGDTRRNDFRREFEARLYQLLGELAESHSIRIREVRVMEGRKSTNGKEKE